MFDWERSPCEGVWDSGVVGLRTPQVQDSTYEFSMFTEPLLVCNIYIYILLINPVYKMHNYIYIYILDRFKGNFAGQP